MIDDTTLERVAAAIELAQCPGREGPYGLYDYTDCGDKEPHRVRDFRDPRSETYGRSVLRTTDKEAARKEYERLTRLHIARAAVEALQEKTLPGKTAAKEQACPECSTGRLKAQSGGGVKCTDCAYWFCY
jgi:hypothetical protein